MTRAGAQEDHYVLLAKIVKPHGVRGELKVLPFTASPQGLENYARLFLSADEGASFVAVTPLKIRSQGKFVLLQLKECLDRTMAESLTGRGIWVDAAQLPSIAEDEFYLHALEGKEVSTDDGQVLGVVTRVLIGGAQDLLTVQGHDKEYLIPLVPEFMVKQEAQQIVLSLPPGLLEINN